MGGKGECRPVHVLRLDVVDDDDRRVTAVRQAGRGGEVAPGRVAEPVAEEERNAATAETGCDGRT